MLAVMGAQRVRGIVPDLMVVVRRRTAATPPTIAVAVSVHGPYLRWLPEALESVERQSRAADERWLICDGCEPPENLPAGWRVVRGDWQSPGPGRNEVLAQTGCSWVCWLDADDAYGAGYLEAMDRAARDCGGKVGVLYPDLTYCDASLEPTGKRAMREWSAADVRRYNFVPTPSCWRVEMLRFAGGWSADVQCMDDWATIVRCSAAGWEGCHVPQAELLARKHGEGRGRKPPEARADTSWRCRRYAIVTLLAGRRDILGQWADWIGRAELPPQTTLWVLDDARNAEFSEAVQREIHRRVAMSVHYRRSDVGELPVAAKHQPHARVAALYNQILQDACACSDLVLMLEDDVLPPLDGARRLNEAFPPVPENRIGVCTGPYPSRCGGGRIVAVSLDPVNWVSNITVEGIKPGINECGMTPGGFTLFDAAALRQCLPMRFTFDPNGRPVGWDGNMSRSMHAHGWKVTYHGDVLCEHHVWSRDHDGMGDVQRLCLAR